VVDNRSGASTNIGTEIALKATPDGATLLFAMSANAINAALYRHLNFNFMRDAEPVASIARIPLVMEVNPAVPAKTVPEFIAYAKANPGKVNLASGGPGTPLYVAGALFSMMADIKMTNVWYRGGEGAAIPDLLSGQVQAMFGVVPSSLAYVRPGRLRALAVTAAKRLPVLPDVPAMAEFLPGYEASGWYGIVAPKGTPAAIVDTLNKQINAALDDPSMRTRLADLGCDIFAGPPADFAKFIENETRKWAEVIKFTGVTVD
jgi:tripartite-type tricarboxylate transporter receptor subunit TctC